MVRRSSMQDKNCAVAANPLGSNGPAPKPHLSPVLPQDQEREWGPSLPLTLQLKSHTSALSKAAQLRDSSKLHSSPSIFSLPHLLSLKCHSYHLLSNTWKKIPWKEKKQEKSQPSTHRYLSRTLQIGQMMKSSTDYFSRN